MSILFLMLSFALAETPSVKFTSDTAELLDQGDWSVGVFAPLKYGLKDDLELSIHPGWAIGAPHLSVKKSYGEKKGWQIASQHQLGYPSPLLKFLARPGIGGILAADSVIPHIVNSDNKVLASKVQKQGMLTVSLGLSGAISIGESDYKTIDVPYGYRKTANYQNYLAILAGMGWENMFNKRVGIRYGIDLWYLPLAEAGWAVEEKIKVLVQVNERVQLNGGANFVVGEYPYGVNWHLLPSFDAVFRW